MVDNYRMGEDLEDWEVDLSPGAQYSLSGAEPIPTTSPMPFQ